LRIGFAGVKVALKEHNSFTATRLGSADTAFLLAYSLGQFVCGRFADLLQPKRTLVFGMVACACLAALQGLMGHWGVQGVGSGFAGWVSVRAADGLFHATGWTSSVAIMGNWFPRGVRGAVFGTWASNSNFGDIFGLHWTALVLETFGDARWYLVQWTLAVLMLTMALVNALFLRSAPPRSLSCEYSNGSQAVPSELDLQGDGSGREVEKEQRVAGIGEVLRVPGLLQYAFSYMFIKLVNYTLFFWLPFFLSEGIGMERSTSAHLATLFDWGFILGGILAGILSDWTSRAAGVPLRSPVVSIFLLLAILPLGTLRAARDARVVAAMIFLCGVLQGGPAEALTSCISVDLGTHPSLQQARATSTCTGIIDGIGALGAAIGQYLVGVLSDTFGWKAAFTFLIASLLGACGLSLLQLRAELRRLRCDRPREAAAIGKSGKAEGNEGEDIDPLPIQQAGGSDPESSS